MYPEINLIMNTRNLRPTVKSIRKLDTLFPVSGSISLFYNILGELYLQTPVDWNDVKWWFWSRNIDCSSPEKFMAKWMLFMWYEH